MMSSSGCATSYDEAILQTSISEQTNGETLFAVGNNHHSIAEIANATVDCMGGIVKFVEWPRDRKLSEIGDAIISNNKLKQMLEWSPEENLESGLLKTKAFYETCLQHYLR